MLKFCVSILFFGIYSYASSTQKILVPNQSIVNKKIFREVEFVDDCGLLLDSKVLSIPGILYAYNASIVRYKNRILLGFRYDIKYKLPVAEPPFSSHIGIVELDDNFQVVPNTFYEIKTGSEHSEDPRLFVYKDALFITYNDFVPDFSKHKTLFLAELNRNFNIEYSTCLDLRMKPVEKNWSPFVYVDMGDENLFFEYSINPHRIYRLTETKCPDLQYQISNEDLFPYGISWWKWGEPRGGTPPIDRGDHYLSFFHSYFRTDDCPIRVWYVMGAYTFEKNPPFKITRMSTAPIIFRNLYDTKIISSIVDTTKRVAYPSGIIEGKYQDRDVFFLSIGENDSAIKILTLDKHKLYESLRDVE